jgi:hypothetical protein
MKIRDAVFSITGAAIALAIFLTLETNFHTIFHESTFEAIQKDVAPFTSDGLFRILITISIYLLIMILGAFLGKLTGSIMTTLIHKMTRKD